MFVDHKKLTWNVEIVGETDTHYIVEGLFNERKWEEPKNDFHNRYLEIIKLDE